VLFLGLHSRFLLELVHCVSLPSAHQLSFFGGFFQDVFFTRQFENPNLNIIKALTEIKNVNCAI